VPNGDEYLVCPEDQGQETQLCNATSCGGDTAHSGLCDLRTDIGNGLYRFCACCPEIQSLDCSSCGGDSGGGRCTGLEQYTGYQYYNCYCTTRDQSVSLHPQRSQNDSYTCIEAMYPFPYSPFRYRHQGFLRLLPGHQNQKNAAQILRRYNVLIVKGVADGARQANLWAAHVRMMSARQSTTLSHVRMLLVVGVSTQILSAPA
jgi:hypothetical protein